MSPIHHHFELARLAGDDRDHPLLADLGDLRRLGAGDLHRRLHPMSSGGAGRDARSSTASPSPARRRCAPCAGAATTSSSPTTTSTTPSAALAAELGVELVAAPDDAASSTARRAVRSRVAGARCAGDAPAVRRRASARRAGRQRDRARLPLGAGATPAGPRPMLAVTGTDGKTTTTLLTVDDAGAAGVRTVAAGNTDVPLVDALDLRRRRVRRRVHELPAGVDPSSSAADAAAWLNLAPDHLNWHAVDGHATRPPRPASSDLQRPDDVAIGFADDPIVMAPPRRGPGRPRHVRRSTGADYHVAATGGRRARRAAAAIAAVAVDAPAPAARLTNALAAAALVLETGLGRPGARRRRRWRRSSGRRTASSRSASRRRALVQRLQGHDAARRVGRDPGLRPRRADRRRAQQGPRPVADGAPSRDRVRAVVAHRRGRAPTIARRVRRRRARRRRRLDGRGRRPRPPSSPRRATSSCSRRVRQLRLVPGRLPGARRRLPRSSHEHSRRPTHRSTRSRRRRHGGRSRPTTAHRRRSPTRRTRARTAVATPHRPAARGRSSTTSPAAPSRHAARHGRGVAAAPARRRRPRRVGTSSSARRPPPTT